MMSAVVTTPADIVNLTLVRIGYKLRIGSLYDGSEAATRALDIYGQTRDQLLRQNDWGFSERNVSLTLLKQAPDGGYIPPTTWNPTTYPPLPWKYLYAYPEDCLKVRTVKPQTLFLFNPNPQPSNFSIVNDNGDADNPKGIVCNIADAICVYSGQITDPTSMEPDFIEAFAAALGRRLVPSLIGSNMVQLAGQDEAVSQKIAESEQG